MVEVSYTAHGDSGPYVKTVKIEANSWQIDDKGNLTVGDSYGNPEASYASGLWGTVTRVPDESDDE